MSSNDGVAKKVERIVLISVALVAGAIALAAVLGVAALAAVVL